jgi:predicted thioesterase
MSQKSRTAEATLRFLPAPGAKVTAEEREVSAVSRVIALMEMTAARLVQQGLDSEQTSVGITMNVTHVDPAVASGDFHGASVRAVARYRGVAGKLHYIVIDAFDESGLIASAEHTRAIVNGRRTRGSIRRRSGMRAMVPGI